MTIECTTNFSRPLVALADLVASSSTLRSVLQAATPELAHERIHLPYGDDRLDPNSREPLDPKPRVLINPTKYFKRTKTGTRFGASAGAIELAFEFLPPEELEKDRNQELLDFIEKIGQIMDEVEEKAGQDKQAGEAVLTSDEFTHLNVTEWGVLDGPAECPARDENGELFYGVVLFVEFIG